MKKLIASSLTALCIGFFAGSKFQPAPPDTEAPAESAERELSFADSGLKEKTAPKSAAVLPDDLYIRLRNEAEKPALKKTGQTAVQTAPLTAPEPPFIEDSASKAHREAASGIKALNSGDCAKASVYLEKAYSLKKDRNILSHYMTALLLCGEAEKAASLAPAADADTLADVIEAAVKASAHRAAVVLFETLEIKGSGKLMNAAGLAYEASGNTGKAVLMYKEAYRLNPADPFISFSRARAADMEEDYAEAVFLYEITAAAAAGAELKKYSVTRSAQIREHLAAGAPKTP
ncbi:tetratricopeptide repeat protein [Geovibrio ferrireducens]|uniref:hypothetical protein n=1 Tax=Geovibrio ferrireducens TaxID=46201 RepID=UPI0022481198|nr:hypothetical protein [Geovibrio ferrireducens]